MKKTISDKKFEKYLREEFAPAQLWADSDEGRKFIRDKIPSLDKLRSKEDAVLAACYGIWINGVNCYAGQSLRTVRRLYVHAANLFFEPEVYFGIRKEEIRSIEMKILTPPIFSKPARLAMEESLVRSLDPVLQPYADIPGMRYDTCLPRGQARRDAMIARGVIGSDK